jgi:crotonobetainyl-CoA:carnitine CoA-transferase CaiB-like acyl-CoA transferase
MANQASNYLIGGQVPGRLGNAHPNIVPYQAFATTDSHIIITVGNDQQFMRFCQVIEQPKWADDQRYATNTARVNNRATLCAQITKHLKQQTSQYWLSKFEDHGVPCGPINTIDQVFNDPQIQSRNMVFTMQDTRAGELKLVANPINYSRSQIEYNLAPPELGNQTIEILQEYLEYTESTLQSLKSKDII